jgi:hypothetical protein
MRFFFDRCLSYRLADIVNAYEGEGGHTARHLDRDSRFTNTTPDVEWMRALATDGEPRWVVLCGDGRILTRPAERQALQEVNLTFFCMARGWINIPLAEQAWKLLKVWPNITEAARLSDSAGRPTLFEVRGRPLTVRRCGSISDLS